MHKQNDMKILMQPNFNPQVYYILKWGIFQNYLKLKAQGTIMNFMLEKVKVEINQ